MISIYREQIKLLARKYYRSKRDRKTTDKYKHDLSDILNRIDALDRELLSDKEIYQLNDMRQILERAIEKVRPRGILWQLFEN